MPPSRPATRRQFLRSTLAGAFAAPLFVPATSFGASDRIVMGCIGMGGRGNSDMRGFLHRKEVRVVAVCDVIQRKRQAAKTRVDQHYGNTDCADTNDFRDITRRDDIDAVLIATPDHWHAIIAIDACEHGKDVFCEKPMSLTIREGRAMVQAARRYGRVFSSGSQRVLGDYGRLARYIRSGAIGKVQEAYVGVGGPSKPCTLPGKPVPPGIDWDLWLGPAPWAPFHPGRLNFRPWRDYSGGGMTDWGAHKFGAVIFAMDLQETGPVEIIPPDGKDHKHLTYVFANGFRMYHGGARDITYVGTEGKASRRNMSRDVPTNVPMMTYKGRGGLQGDFLHCARTRQRPFRDVEFGHRAAAVCHLGNIAYWLKRPLKFDPVKEQMVGDPEAGRWLDRPKRAPWRL
ncbi:MAG: Gfo/Idh/MocA family protein [Candidatus Brocadiia bacterium]